VVVWLNSPRISYWAPAVGDWRFVLVSCFERLPEIKDMGTIPKKVNLSLSTAPTSSYSGVITDPFVTINGWIFQLYSVATNTYIIFQMSSLVLDWRMSEAARLSPWCITNTIIAKRKHQLLSTPTHANSSHPSLPPTSIVTVY
jgi:hypothetical protein